MPKAASIRLQTEAVSRVWPVKQTTSIGFVGCQAGYVGFAPTEFTGNDPGDGRQIGRTARFYVDGPLLYQVFAFGNGGAAVHQAIVESLEFLTEPGAVLHG